MPGAGIAPEDRAATRRRSSDRYSRPARQLAQRVGAGGGDRTHTLLSEPRILSPRMLEVVANGQRVPIPVRKTRVKAPTVASVSIVNVESILLAVFGANTTVRRVRALAGTTHRPGSTSDEKK